MEARLAGSAIPAPAQKAFETPTRRRAGALGTARERTIEKPGFPVDAEGSPPAVWSRGATPLEPGHPAPNRLEPGGIPTTEERLAWPAPARPPGDAQGTPTASSDTPSPFTSPGPATEAPYPDPAVAPDKLKRREPLAPERTSTLPGPLGARPHGGPEKHCGAPTTTSGTPSPLRSPQAATDWPKKSPGAVPFIAKRNPPVAPEKTVARPASVAPPGAARGPPTTRSAAPS